jgi:hypothetical protein
VSRSSRCNSLGFGARVIATTSTTDKAERLNALGTSEVIHCAETPDWTRRRELALAGHIQRLLAHGSAVAGRDFCSRGSVCQRPGGARQGPDSPQFVDFTGTYVLPVIFWLTRVAV